jgi:hypothetical protein
MTGPVAFDVTIGRRSWPFADRSGPGELLKHYRQSPSCSTYACPVTRLPRYRPVTLAAPS